MLKSIVNFFLKNYFEIICLTSVGFFFFIIAIDLPCGIDSLNFIRVFNNDEARGVTRLKQCIENNNLDPNAFYYYGMFYYTICFGIGKIVLLFQHSSELSIWTIAFILKCVSFFSLLLFSFAFFRICLLFLTKEWSWLCLMAMISIESFYLLGQMIHPDMLQIALVIVCFNFVFKKHTSKSVYLGQFIGGLAFGTKYNSIFSFPFLFLPYLLQQHYSTGIFTLTKKQVMHFFSVSFISGGCFLLGWLLFNPYSIINFKLFSGTFLINSYNVGKGSHEVGASANPFLWFPIFVNEIPLFTLLLLSLSMPASFFIRQKLKPLEPKYFNLVTIVLYSVVCVAYLFLIIRLREMRYGFHFIPMLFIVCFFVLETGFKNLKIKFNFLLPLLLAGSVITLLMAANNFSVTSKKNNNPLLKSGELLINNFRNDIVIYCDFYTYIPEDFKNIYFDWAINKSSLLKVNPDVVIINRKRSGKKVWKQPGTILSQMQWEVNYTHYPIVIRRQKEFYKYMFDTNCAYKIFYEDDAVIIFSRK